MFFDIIKAADVMTCHK